MEGAWNWGNLDPGSAPGLHNRLAQFEKQTWNEIFVRDKYINHGVDRDQIVPAAIRRLYELELDDHEKIWSLHVTSKQRIWGLLVEDIFYLLWWDPEHEVCPSPLKHT